jgi:hypothetical protein
MMSEAEEERQRAKTTYTIESTHQSISHPTSSPILSIKIEKYKGNERIIQPT